LTGHPLPGKALSGNWWLILLGFNIDTGAMYRAIAWIAKEEGHETKEVHEITTVVGNIMNITGHVGDIA
jgi:hypothetical protein